MKSNRFYVILALGVAACAFLAIGGYVSNEWTGKEAISTFFETAVPFVGIAFVIKASLDQSRKVKAGELVPSVQQTRDETLARAEEADSLPGAPCTVSLIWKRGTGMPVSPSRTDALASRVFLNGEEQTPLMTPGRGVKMQTSLVQNEILIAHQAGVYEGPQQTFAFTAEPGGKIAILFDYAQNEFELVDNKHGAIAEPDAKGMLHPRGAAYWLLALWSFLNIFPLMLGAVAMFKLIGALQEPYMEKYPGRMRSVLLWNLIGSALTVTVVLMFIKWSH